MTTCVEVEADRPVVVKRAGADDEARLRREGERLRRASHPGVVPILRSEADGDGWVVSTGYGGRPLHAIGPLRAAQVASLVAGLATTLADLHDLGVVHGRIDASHVLVGEEGRPLLCGFGHGEPPARPEDDVAALGALLVQLLGTDDPGDPIPERRWLRVRATRSWERRALLLLADQCAAEPATRRPTARRLATSVAEAVPGTGPIAPPSIGSLEPLEDAELDPIERLRATAVVDLPVPSRPGRAAALAAAGALVVLLGGLHLAGDGPASPPATRRAPVEATPTAPAERPAPQIAAAVQGGVLEVDDRRYRVGQPGDALLVDDWDCDGVPTPALLRPATGEVFVFPRWVDRGTLAVEPVDQIEDAHSLLGQRDGDACPSLVVRTADGSLVPVVEGGR